MPRRCTVCAHEERAEIDRRLSFQVCNVAALAREFGLKDDALHAHRRNHLPAFLPALQARADALTLSQLQAEAMRLYNVTLDALAGAEAGTLRRINRTDPETGEEVAATTKVVSHAAVAHMIREARAGLDQLARLAADRPDEPSGPSNVGSSEWNDRISEALQRAIARTSVKALGEPHELDAVADAELVEDDRRELGPAERPVGDAPVMRSGADRTASELPPDSRHPKPARYRRSHAAETDRPACRRRQLRQ